MSQGIWEASERGVRWNFRFYLHSAGLVLQPPPTVHLAKSRLEWESLPCRLRESKKGRPSPGKWLLCCHLCSDRRPRLSQQNFEFATLAKNQQPLCYLQGWSEWMAEFQSWCRVDFPGLEASWMEALEWQVKELFVWGEWTFSSSCPLWLASCQISRPWSIIVWGLSFICWCTTFSQKLLHKGIWRGSGLGFKRGTEITKQGTDMDLLQPWPCLPTRMASSWKERVPRSDLCPMLWWIAGMNSTIPRSICTKWSCCTWNSTLRLRIWLKRTRGKWHLDS